MPPRWLLDDELRPHPATLLEWARWLSTQDNAVVGLTETTEGVCVSTRFVGIELPEVLVEDWPGSGLRAEVVDARSPMPRGVKRRLLFETLVMGGEHDHRIERYETWSEAKAGHDRWVAAVSTRSQPTRAIALEETKE